MKVNPDGRRCHCGGRGCWETEIGAAAILRRAGRRSTDFRAAVLRVLGDASAGDATASKAISETVRWIGRGTADLINIFNPDLVVFGGTLREVGWHHNPRCGPNCGATPCLRPAPKPILWFPRSVLMPHD